MPANHTIRSVATCSPLQPRVGRPTPYPKIDMGILITEAPPLRWLTSLDHLFNETVSRKQAAGTTYEPSTQPVLRSSFPLSEGGQLLGHPDLAACPSSLLHIIAYIYARQPIIQVANILQELWPKISRYLSQRIYQFILQDESHRCLPLLLIRCGRPPRHEQG
jgi:hypothetical protein